MPGSTLPNTGITLPSDGSDSGVWGAENNANWSNYDAHSHKPGSGARITTAAISIDGDLSFGSLYAATNLARAQFTSAVVPANNLCFFVSNGSGGLTAGELYWRNNTGNSIRVTSGNALNFAAFVGGIGGDYSAVGAAENFDDSQKQYTFKDGSTNWARLHAGNVRFAPFGGTSAFFVEMAAPGGLGANYTLTLPTALPASGSRWLLVGSTGQLTTSVTLQVPAKNGAVGGGALGDGVITLAGAGSATYIAVPLLQGLTAVNAAVTYNPSGGTIAVATVKTASTGAVTTTAIFTDAVAGWKTSTPFSLATTVGANEYYEIKVSGVGALVSGVTVTYA